MDRFKIGILFSIYIVCCFISPYCFSQTIPMDKEVVVGKLKNGLTYYIRKNNYPEKQAQLYLVNKVGSLQEDDDQQGLAHFIEHMNFNGTKHFPKHQLVDALEKIGVKFGADLNAHTSFGETVYQIPIPTDKSEQLKLGLDILRDWAKETLFESEEINNERGIILEEERLRNNVESRMAKKYYGMLFNNSRFANRFPIGIDSVIKKADRGVFMRYYNDWYRPDLQAVIVVGDIDVKETENLIIEKFSNLKMPSNVRPYTRYSISLKGKNQFQVVTDAEKEKVSLQLFYKREQGQLVQQKDYKVLILRTLLNTMLSLRRHAFISSQNDPAFINMNISIQDLIGGINALVLDITAKEGREKESFQQVYSFVEQIRRYGFTDQDLIDAKIAYNKQLDNSWSERGKMSSVGFVQEYQKHFIEQQASPGIAWERDFSKSFLPTVSLQDIQTILTDYLRPINRDILILAPNSKSASLPDQNLLEHWMNEVENRKLGRLQDRAKGKVLLETLPKSGKVISTKLHDSQDIKELTFSNGVHVLLKKTSFKNDEVLFGAFAPGGTSLYKNEDFYNAFNAAPMIMNFGIGNLNPDELLSTLRDKNIQVSTGINPRSQVLRGKTSVNDIETALQLAYLYFTAPRKDNLIYQNTIDKAIENINSRYANPMNVFSDTIAYVMGNYNYRAESPTLEKIRSLNLDRMYEIYRERFADASGFTFSFVGNYDEQKLIPLLELYLGGLPSIYKKENPIDLGIHIPAGKIIKKVFSGTENKAYVRQVVSGDYDYSPYNNLAMRALADILQSRLLEQLREKQGEVYSPSVQVSYNKLPKARFAYIINYGCLPENAKGLTLEVQKQMDDIRTMGVRQDELDKFKAAYLKNVEMVLKDNGFWMQYLLSQVENEESMSEVDGVEMRVEKLTIEELNNASQTFFGRGNRIDFELLPESARN